MIDDGDEGEDEERKKKKKGSRMDGLLASGRAPSKYCHSSGVLMALHAWKRRARFVAKKAKAVLLSNWGSLSAGCCQQRSRPSA